MAIPNRAIAPPDRQGNKDAGRLQRVVANAVGLSFVATLLFAGIAVARNPLSEDQPGGFIPADPLAEVLGMGAKIGKYVASQIFYSDHEAGFLDAAASNDLDAVDRFIGAGGNLHAKRQHGETGLMLAAEKGYRDVAVKIIEGDRTVVNDADKEGKTALDYAYYGKLAVVVNPVTADLFDDLIAFLDSVGARRGAGFDRR